MIKLILRFVVIFRRIATVLETRTLFIELFIGKQERTDILLPSNFSYISF